ncbi:hypothetical protein ACFY5F_48550 [Streptomyces sp. NPDC013161]|uniref:hypothetical protein n=1 Tax=Streptomyces sp. NPDC013161 TaxID=3364862 RepID=UPI003678231D
MSDMRYLAIRDAAACEEVSVSAIEDQLFESLKSLRDGAGLTANKLKGHPLLLHMLDVDSREEGYAKLNDLSQLIPDDDDQRKAARNALSLGYTPGNGIEDRRKRISRQAEGATAEISTVPRQVARKEDKGFKGLALLIIEHSSSPLTADHAGVPESYVSTTDSSSAVTVDTALQFILNMIEKIKVGFIVLAFVFGFFVCGALMTNTSLSDEIVNKAFAKKYDHVDPKGPNSAESALTKPPAAVTTAASKSSESGWGPKRPTFSDKKPAPYAVFNSITDNSLHGDERSFTQCRDKEASNWSTQLEAQDGHVYQCYIWFENAAAPNIAKGNPAAWLQDARARVVLPGQTSKNVSLVGVLSAANSRTVWSSCQFTADENVRLSYRKSTTAIQRIPYYDELRPVGDTIATSSGILLGGEKFDGIIRQDVGYVLFDVNATLEKN